MNESLLRVPSAEQIEEVRLDVFATFAELGRPPSLSEIASRTGLEPDAVTAALHALHDSHHLVLGGGEDQIVMAHPFASVPLGFSVMGTRALWWGVALAP
ncbi:MAG: hypothetical protein ACRDT6_28555 [Micromonosporaceae bacterium]